jgi:hypothetical protein
MTSRDVVLPHLTSSNVVERILRSAFVVVVAEVVVETFEMAVVVVVVDTAAVAIVVSVGVSSMRIRRRRL